jgi:beta-phosphoglucomutase-like phosphatase (HAD superfamily)
MEIKLTIFDFDDTLILSNSNISITHSDGSTEVLSSHEYAKYKERPGDTFDFSEFDEYPQDATLINDSFQSLKAAMSAPGEVIILTARANIEPVEQFLSDNGVTGIDIVGVGSSNPMDKAKHVLALLKEEKYSMVHVYEDNFKNIRAIKKVVDKQGIRFQSTKVAAGSIISESTLIIKRAIREQLIFRRKNGVT